MSAFSWFVFRSFFIYFLSGSNFRIVHEKEIFKNFYSKYICFSFTMMNLNHDRARDLKNSGKYGSGLSCRWALFPAWAFGFKLHLIFHRVEFKKPVFYLVDFHGKNWRIPDFYENKVQQTTLSLILHLNQQRSVLFSLSLTPSVEPKILQLIIMWHNLQAVVRVGSKMGL